ncbi:MAG: C40 family peptidase [Bacteroidota bacterium]|nr:C40 family peptidase [Bacteroidota bacterium]MDP4194038.1 C40 family peptidase [Bacteroidota bacterium]
MILKRFYKILLWGIIALFIFGTSPYYFAAKSKKHSTKKPSSSATAVSSGKKGASKKSSSKKASSKKESSKKESSEKETSRKTSKKKSLASKKKLSSKKLISSSKDKRKRKADKTAKSKTLSFLPSRKDIVKKDTSRYVSPDDLPALEDDPEDLPVETQTVNVSDLLEKYVVSNQYAAPSDSVNLKEKIIMEIIKYLDTPYKFGGNTSKGIDCSAFTKTIFANSFSLELPRTAREQFQLGEEINDKSELKFGDLIFFNTRKRVRPGHVGIYIGDNMFAHSSSSQGVMVSSLETDFYSRKFMGGRRMNFNLVRR